MWPKDSSFSSPKSQIVSRLPQNNVHTLMQCLLSFHFPAACPILVLSSTTIWMSEFLQVPILQAVRAALPQGLILCTDIICPAFTDHWKCDFISSLQVPAPLGLPLNNTPKRVVRLRITLFVEHHISCAIPAGSHQAGKICCGYISTPA
jgi:hypothetical protein